MLQEPLTQALILLGAAVFVVTLARRLRLPAILGYLIVGIALGHHALGLLAESTTTQLLSQLGVVFMLFTLGLEFSWPRMVALRREVFGLGAVQVFATTALIAVIAWALGLAWWLAVVVGGAVAMSSTVIIVQQLTEQAELNRTHGRLAFSVLLFQDLAVVPFLALAGAIASGTTVAGGEAAFVWRAVVTNVVGGVVAVSVVLLVGRYLLRPMLYLIAHSRLRELFTLAVLLVALGSAWASNLAGVSMATGAFLAGMMLAETEYRHQVDAVIRPFRDILLGLFFIFVGTLLDLGVLVHEAGKVLLLLSGLFIAKALVATFAARAFGFPAFKAIRTGVTLAIGGELGLALLAILQRDNALPYYVGQPLLVALVLSMVLSPLALRNNKRVARLLLGEQGPPATALSREDAATINLARREHVIVCGFGRVGQNIARVLESQGFEYIALDLDPLRIRNARQAGDPVMYGDSADEAVLRTIGVENASAVIITFADPATSLGIIRVVRALRPNVPILVRTQDDLRLKELRDAGATEVVPETFEASLMLVSHVLMLLHVPVSRVLRAIGEIRGNRYATLRSVFRRDSGASDDHTGDFSEELKSVVLPPGAFAVGRSLDELRTRGAEVAFTGVRRQGILGREPDPAMTLREGDIVVLYGLPEALEHAEAVLLAG